MQHAAELDVRGASYRRSRNQELLVACSPSAWRSA